MTLPTLPTLPDGYTIRPATVQDAELIATQRDAMFIDMGESPEKLAPVRAGSVQWHAAQLAAGTYTGFLVEFQGRVVSGAGLLWTTMPPNPQTASHTRAYVMNVYVEPAHRGKALARTLMQAVHAECERRGVNIVTLTASHAGRPTYEKLGYKPQAEMKLVLPGET